MVDWEKQGKDSTTVANGQRNKPDAKLTGILVCFLSSSVLRLQDESSPEEERSLRSFSIISTQKSQNRERGVVVLQKKKKKLLFANGKCSSSSAINQTSITTYLISRHTISFDGLRGKNES